MGFLWQTKGRDWNCNSGGRFAAATVMQTTFIPTRSGDGTFVLEIGLYQYTLFGLRTGSIHDPFDCVLISNCAELFAAAATCLEVQVEPSGTRAKLNWS
jgi:hypothetical protein